MLTKTAQAKSSSSEASVANFIAKMLPANVELNDTVFCTPLIYHLQTITASRYYSVVIY